MGLGGREDAEKACNLEETILVQGGTFDSYQSTLSSLLIYFMFIFVIAKRVCRRLEKLQRDFLWEGGSLENKPHIVSWLKVCKPKVEGGLGIRNLSILNKALLGKWSWRFMAKEEPLWKKVIVKKYGVDKGG